jgi:hypothetical protein
LTTFFKPKWPILSITLQSFSHRRKISYVGNSPLLVSATPKVHTIPAFKVYRNKENQNQEKLTLTPRCFFDKYGRTNR